MRFKPFVVAVFPLLLLVSSAYAQNLYYLPHVANGNFGAVSFRTTFILFNNSDADVPAVLKLTDNNGNPLTATIGGLGSGSQFNITLGAGATNILQTDGLGNGAVGAATVTATAAIGVSAIFTIYDANGSYMTEAGVGSSVPSTEFVLPVDSTGFFLTGLALFNPGGSSASITMTLINTDGSQVDRTTQSLGAGAHSAAFLAVAGQLFPTVSNFRGTLVVQSSAAIAAVVLRQYQNSSTGQLTYTSLPVVPRSSTKLTLNLAQVANGSYGSISFKTSFLIFNMSPTSPANVTLALTQDNGSPFTVTIPGSGPGTGTNSSFNLSLAAGASLFLQTDGLGAGTAGAATITSNVPIGAAAIFTVLDPQGQFQTEAGVGDSPVLTSLTLPVDITGSFNTGVAFFNPGASSVTLTFRLLDANGSLVGSSATRTLPGKGHLAEFVTGIFPVTGSMQGSVAISSTGGVAATTLRQYSSPPVLSYTTLPVASGTASGKTSAAPLLSKTQSGISATSNVTVNQTLPPGFKLSGKISGPGQGIEIVASAGQDSVYAGQVDPQTSRYLIVLPAGTYNLKVGFEPAGVPSDAVVIATYSDANPVQVSGDTTRDMTLPSVTLFNISGSASGLSNLPSSSNAKVVFTSDNNTIEGEFNLGTNGSYQGVLPAGNYVASIGAAISFSLLQRESVSLFNVGSATVSGSAVTANFTVPATARLSGNVQGAGLTLTPGISVLASDTSAPRITELTFVAPPSESSVTADFTGQYQMILTRGRSFEMDILLPLIAGTDVLGFVSYPIPASVVNMSGDTTFDFNLPAFPGQVTVSGRVTDSGGRGVSDVSVGAFSQSVTGAPNLGFIAGAQTDANGNYSFVVLSGTNYQITFTPPTPAP